MPTGLTKLDFGNLSSWALKPTLSAQEYKKQKALNEAADKAIRNAQVAHESALKAIRNAQIANFAARRAREMVQPRVRKEPKKKEHYEYLIRGKKTNFAKIEKELADRWREQQAYLRS